MGRKGNCLKLVALTAARNMSQSGFRGLSRRSVQSSLIKSLDCLTHRQSSGGVGRKSSVVNHNRVQRNRRRENAIDDDKSRAQSNGRGAASAWQEDLICSVR